MRLITELRKSAVKVGKGMNMVRRRPRGLNEWIKSYYSYLGRKEIIAGKPTHVTIEPTNLCNYRCPVCETGAKILKREQGMMSYDNFVQITNEIYQHTNRLLFYFMGEPFLNKDAYRMIEYAKEKNIYVDTCTNGELVDGEELIRSGIDEVDFQIGGLTQETHEIYRVGGNLEKIVENIKETVRARDSSKGLDSRKRTKIILGFIVMRQNEHEVKDVPTFAEQLGVDELNIIDPCVRTVEQGKRFLPDDKTHWIYNVEAFDKGILVPKVRAWENSKGCPWIYFSTVITWNGDVVPCCRDPHGKYVMGNILEQGLDEIWNNQKYREFRRRILTNQRGVDICQLCSGYGLPNLK